MIREHKHEAVFLCLIAAICAAGWLLLCQTAILSWQSDDYTHILLILPISMVLILLEWRSLKHILKWNIRGGSSLLAAALAIVCITAFTANYLPGDEQLSIRMAALVLSWIGAFMLCFGSRASRGVLFPLLFLFGLVPLPKFVLNDIIAMLQQGSVWSAHALFAACGVPVSANGIFLKVPGLTVEVAKECSSIRSSSMLLVTTLVLVHLLLRSPWRKLLVIALALPLSVAKNGLRIFTIVMLGTKVDPGYLDGRLHHQGGILFFAVALSAVFVAIWILGKRENSMLRASGVAIQRDGL